MIACVGSHDRPDAAGRKATLERARACCKRRAPGTRSTNPLPDPTAWEKRQARNGPALARHGVNQQPAQSASSVSLLLVLSYFVLTGGIRGS
ncbi:hypothetical protein VFPFJ_02765 [Purpureocillium lilacinum]|uniref:Uncharacterized protein n=1 Tax=Purpureocillium lilacinum TaxID=33203 RepID=A0A179HW82_PURLI|nr:hypothetical protein VFPFJ_02765 [Purpureocillium lilacinum]OAQ93603.1 hypothetical protein VFPFJ_02765 [Purpureocillium lilacinum]